MSIVAVESGDGTGFAARVTSAGHILAEIANTPTVALAEPIEVEAPQATLTSTLVTINSGTVQTVVSRTGRRQVLVQNLSGANVLHLRLAASDPTTADLRIDPGEKWSLPCGVAYEGEFRILAQGGNIATVIYEFA